MRSGFTPSASALKLVTMRCRSTGGATARTSSMPGAKRPASTARALAPRTRYCAARGPAPQVTQSLTNVGRLAPRARVGRASVTA